MNNFFWVKYACLFKLSASHAKLKTNANNKKKEHEE